MNKKVRISKEPEERKQEILETAARLFVEKGYYGVSVEEVASEIGIVKGTCYRYFSNKQELFMAALGLAGEKFVSEISDILEDSTVSVNERLKIIYLKCEARFSQMKPLMNDYNDEKQYNQQALDILRTISFYKLSESTKVLLEDGCKEGLFKIEDITARAYSIMFSIFGITSAPINSDNIMKELNFVFERLLGINIK